MATHHAEDFAFDAAEKTKRFEEWFGKSSVFCSQNIRLQNPRQNDGSRGLYATHDIVEDEPLFTLSRSLVLNVENSDLSRQTFMNDLDPWIMLIIVLMHERSKATESFWNQYLDVLPIASPSFQPLMLWPQESLDELQASPVTGRIGKHEAEETFNSALLPILKENKSVLHPKLFPENEAYIRETLLPLFHGAGSVIMAYAFDIEKNPSTREQDEEGFVSDDEDALLPKGLIPMADMLNADADKNNARLFYEEDTLTMRAIKPIKAKQQIFNDYGPLPRSELLRRYGYVTPRYERYDVAELSSDRIVSLAREKFGVTPEVAKERLNFFDERHGLADGYDITRYQGSSKANDDAELPECPFDAELIDLVDTLLLPQIAFENSKERKSRRTNLSEKQMALEILELLRASCEEQRSRYSTSADEDFYKLHKQTVLRNEMKSQWRRMERSDDKTQLDRFQQELLEIIRHCQALEVRIGEKTVLRDAEIYAQEMSSQILERQTKKRVAEDPNSPHEPKKSKS